jgi:ABC-2 type transport system ATP-binding protein
LRNRVRAVDGIDLDVRRGEVFGLLGPNGSGKSTTIKIILGLLHPTAGHVLVFGKRPDDVATKRQIGYLPEESYLYRFLNARETLDYYGRLFHLPRATRRGRIDMLLEMVGLQGVQRRPVGEYSKGMQRRIGLAQALINDPALLILDEPTSGLDPIGSRQIKDLIHELSRRGKTILLCSHLLGDVEDVCQRVAIMFGGKIRSLGTVDELLTERGQTILQTPELDAETITQIEALLQRRGRCIEKVQQPRQKLETLFLEIVQQAQAEGQATSGALSGGKLAGFLVQEGGSGDDGTAVIDQLVEAARPGPDKGAKSAAVKPMPADPHDKSGGVSSTPTPVAQDSSRPAPAASTTVPVDDSVVADLMARDWAHAQTSQDGPVQGSTSQETAASAVAASAAVPTPVPAGAEAQPAGSKLFEQPPTAEEAALIDSLVTQGWGRREGPTPQQATPPVRDTPAARAAAIPAAAEEAPFDGFLQAMSDADVAPPPSAVLPSSPQPGAAGPQQQDKPKNPDKKKS